MIDHRVSSSASTIIQPYPYQEPVIVSVVEALRSTGRALYVMATGTGKTLVSAFAIKRLCKALSSKKRVLFVAHMNDLLDQAKEEYAKIFPNVRSAHITGTEKKGLDPSVPLVFATFQSLQNVLSFLRPDAFDVVVVDESHHAQAGSFKEVIEHFTPKFLIGMTATPDRMDGDDIREIFGNEVATITLAEAIVKGYVSPVKYRVLSLASQETRQELRSEVLRRERRWSLADVEGRLFANLPEKLGDIFFTEIGKGKAITTVFANSIDETDSIAEQINERFRRRLAYAYHSDLSRRERSELLKRFKARKIRFLIVVDALNEGVDVPVMDRLAFLRSTQSKTIFVQQLGRGLRLQVGKIVEVLDFVGNIDRVRMLRDLIAEIRAIDATSEKSNESLNIEGFDFAEVEDIVAILNEIERNFYPTLAEASAAAQSLGIKTFDEYNAAYRKDPRLHSAPYLFYSSEWSSWPEFLGGEKKNFYPTLAEASAAVQGLGIQTCGEYSFGYRKDSRLPADPDKTYSSEWSSWPEFLGGEKKNFYPTLAEASAAVQGLGIKTGGEYYSNYHKDSKLPSNPDNFYSSEWLDWPRFLGGTKKCFYRTIIQAAAAARCLGIKTGVEYSSNYRKDPRLPANPRLLYSAEWKGWPEFFKLRRRSKQGGVNKGFYSTLAEAAAAAQKLGITSKKGYRLRYHKDRRLHSAPYLFYSSEWSSWPDFLGMT